ncbi:MAG TPA: PAS domain S-box protein, partial [Anaerolineales bacterium]|nr:PAS domain S-box protein [Anaerolineales bacterium]
LIQSEQAYRTLFENVPVGLYRTTSDGYWLDVNPALIRMFGYADRESLLAVKVEDLYVDSSLHQNFYREITKDDVLINLVSEFRKKDGTTFWAEDHIQTIRDESGNPIFFEGSLIDITERLHAQVEIKNLAKFPDENPDSIMRLNDKGIILYANKSSREMLEAWKTEVGQMVPPSILMKTLEVLETQAQQDIEVSLGLRVLSFIITPVIEEGYVNLYGRDITERKRSVEALRESEERFHSLFNRMMDGVYRSRHEGKFVDVNPAMVDMFGYSSREEMLAVDIKNELYFEPEERGSHILDTGQEEMDVYRMRRKDGSEIWVEDHGSYVHDEQGKIIYHEGILRDITERRRSDNFLQTLNNAALATQSTTSSDEMFTAVSSELAKVGLSCAILVVDESGTNLIPKYLSYDPSAMRAAEKLTGIDRSSFHIPVKSVDAFRLPITNRQAVFLESISEVLQQALPAPIKILAGQLTKILKIPKTINAPIMMENKIIGLFSVQSKDLRASDLPAIVALANQLAASWHRSQLYELTRKEIEERKQSEEALREAQMIAGLGSYVLDIPSGNWTSSDILNRLFGIDESYNRSVENWIALVHPNGRQEISDYFSNEVLGNHILFDREYKVIRKNDGAERWVHGLGKLELDSHDEPIKMRGTIRDITESKQAEEALQKAEIKYRMLLERLPVVVYTSELGDKGAWPYVSPQIEQLLGFTADEWMADPGLWYRQVHPEDRDRQQKLEDQAWARQEQFEGEYRIFTRDGRQIWIRDSAQILPPQNNSEPIVQGVLMDITERKQAEEKLRESEEKYRLLFESNPLPMWIYD